jgi:hypothetical protein
VHRKLFFSLRLLSIKALWTTINGISAQFQHLFRKHQQENNFSDQHIYILYAQFLHDWCEKFARKKSEPSLNLIETEVTYPSFHSVVTTVRSKIKKNCSMLSILRYSKIVGQNQMCWLSLLPQNFCPFFKEKDYVRHSTAPSYPSLKTHSMAVRAFPLSVCHQGP